MAVPPEGTPCWADVMSRDAEEAKSFYGDVLGWTFRDLQTDYGTYTQACTGGHAVAAVVPPIPGQEERAAWCVYLASPDVAATAARIREHGGEILLEPMRADDLGAMLLARDPGGVVFGVWQAGTHEGFGTTGVTGAYCWSEIFTREPGKSDAFFPAVFGYRAKQLDDPEVDFRLFDVDGDTVLGRMRMPDDFLPDVPPFINPYFAVEDCDATVARATRWGAVSRFGPADSPFGRFATIGDPHGALFSVIDPDTARGEIPKAHEVA
ncbi:hydrolase [Streptomyces ruber]|uniref:Hydrolase n=2 Tax=Streptomyces TaxID=1883 RepID=A0A918ES16_9ACTN|nr:VOC family protein [Streptomyces ruber]GGQ50514.1 hydrolase [Streptomyces ruber]